MELGLEGKTAMITGGSRGLGRRIAEALGREGCAISICARDEGQLNTSVAEMAAMGYRVQGTPADVTQESDAQRFYDEMVTGMGNPDILVNNVGGRRGSVLFEETSMEQFREGLEVNLFSAVQLSALVLPHMKEQGWGADHQHFVDIRAGARRVHRLYDGQGGTDRLLQAPGTANGTPRSAGQLRSPGLH